MKYIQTVFLALVLLSTQAQKKTEKKYNSLLWEISGNGLKKPSYLFGTMHVSSKLAFNLSDSFYNAIRSVDKVAIELNPETWQEDMVRWQKSATDWALYSRSYFNDMINEYSFRIDKYDDELKDAFASQPPAMNMLLYRTYEQAQDFEEDTFLDMYIYQTGKKLGKQATGVENFAEAERLVADAYKDMQKDKKARRYNYSEDMYEAPKKLQEAYRNGDLDLLDSLNKLMQPSEVFLEKFLYVRNINQANAIDSILKKNTLFVGVGSAHLPGARGVIELLRKKGYTLRPIFMKKRDVLDKDRIEKIRVPVNFQSYTSPDGFFKLNAPGKLYEYVSNISSAGVLQYADMANGVYYTVNRIKTHASFIGHDDKIVMKKIDSLLYENIPGKILSRTTVNRNGYTGLDIVNRTRRGDVQRRMILVTPFEVLVFRMSGIGDYVLAGTEANSFFGSVQLKDYSNAAAVNFEPPSGGFSIQLPHEPYQLSDSYAKDGNQTWQYEAWDKANNKAFVVWKKAVQQYDFMEDDSFHISLANESFMRGDFYDKTLSNEYHSWKGYPCLDVMHQLKDGTKVSLRFIIKGPYYYMLGIRNGKDRNADLKFFDSFVFTPYRYGPPQLFTDTAFNFSVFTPVRRVINDTMRRIGNYALGLFNNSEQDDENYTPVDYEGATFASDSTGEMIGLGILTYNQYYRAKDTASFWKEESGELARSAKFILKKKEMFQRGDSIVGYNFLYTDTGCSKLMKRTTFLYKNRMYRLNWMSDTLQPESDFSRIFFSTIKPCGNFENVSVFSSKSAIYFKDLYSSDTTVRNRAVKAVKNINFSAADINDLIKGYRQFNFSEKNYFVNKEAFINAIASIDDKNADSKKLNSLLQLYNEALDTSSLQAVILQALADLKTSNAVKAVRDIMIKDPPVFEEDYEYNRVFESFSDSLPLAKELYPELLQLVSIDDYKQPVLDLLSRLVDSGYVQSKDYESYLSKLMFDMKFAMKKLKGADERLLNKQMKQNDEEEAGAYDDNISLSLSAKDVLTTYASLLAPFYKNNEAVRTIFSKLLETKDNVVKLRIAVIMLRNHLPVEDSVLMNLASKDEQRADLYSDLSDLKMTDRFPAKYKNQVDLARGYIYAELDEKPDTVILIEKRKIEFFKDSGWVYFFKYKPKNSNDWLLAISGMQPLNENSVAANDDYVRVTRVKTETEEPLDKIITLQLKKLLFARRKSSREFFSNDYSRYSIND